MLDPRSGGFATPNAFISTRVKTTSPQGIIWKEIRLQNLNLVGDKIRPGRTTGPSPGLGRRRHCQLLRIRRYNQLSHAYSANISVSQRSSNTMICHRVSRMLFYQQSEVSG